MCGDDEMTVELYLILSPYSRSTIVAYPLGGYVGCFCDEETALRGPL